MKTILFLIFFVLLCSCTPASQNQTTSDQNLQNGTQEKPSGLADGYYVFDTEAFKKAQLKDEKSEFKKLKKEELDKMLKIFQPFTIELKGNEAVATFSHDVIKGRLQPISRGSEGLRLKMVPHDKDKNADVVTLHVNGSALIVDPGKNESDKMFFKKLVE